MDWFVKKFQDVFTDNKPAPPPKPANRVVRPTRQDFKNPPIFDLMKQPQAPRVPGLSFTPPAQKNVYTHNGVPFYAPGYNTPGGPTRVPMRGNAPALPAMKLEYNPPLYERLRRY